PEGAVDEGIEREGAGEAGPRPVELGEQRGEEDAERVLGAVGEEEDQKGAGDDDPPVVDRRPHGAAGRDGDGAGGSEADGAGMEERALSSMAEAPRTGVVLSILVRLLKRPTESRMRPQASVMCRTHADSLASGARRAAISCRYPRTTASGLLISCAAARASRVAARSSEVSRSVVSAAMRAAASRQITIS